MATQVQRGNPEELVRDLVRLLHEFEDHLNDVDLRAQVRALVPVASLLGKLGSSLIADEDATSARDRILVYLCRYPYTVIAGEELAVVSGISEYARRVRELRVEFGWPIYSGVTAKQIIDEDRSTKSAEGFQKLLTPEIIEALRPDDYLLLGQQDREAALRWNVANEVRRKRGGMKQRLLQYLRLNVGHQVTGEELRYVAKGQSWPRRVRELRTEYGWPVMTRSSGRPDLPIGVYVLEADRQARKHDRKIPDPIRVGVLERDNFRCQKCGWTPAERKEGDPRTVLELHHIKPHATGGENDISNLVTLCNVHHDEIHAGSGSVSAPA